MEYAFFAVILFAAVQYIKKQSDMRKINPLIILAALSLFGGIVYGVLSGVGLWSSVVHWFGIVAPVANLIYTVLAEMAKAASGGQNPLRQSAL